MDLNEIKEIIESDGGKFIIIEQGKPIMVVISFEEYKRKLRMRENNPKSQKPTVHPPVPQELREEGELKIEDLPF